MRALSRPGDTLRVLLLALTASFAVACGRRAPELVAGLAPPPVAAPSATLDAAASDTVGGARPAWMVVPENRAKGKALPLVVMLHAYGATGTIEEWFFRFRSLAESRGFLYVVPNGTPNAEGKNYWNATDACCAPPPGALDGGAPPNDVEYLRELVGEIASKHDVDPKRIYAVGHSNGGFMAHRLACEHPELFAAIVSVAGATFDDPAKCKPAAPIAVLQIHGTADATIPIGGGMFFGHKFPGARTTVDRWAALNGCDPTPSALDERFDLDLRVLGPETRALRFAGCRAHSVVELWWMEGSGHVPLTTSEVGARIVEFLLAHPKT